MRRASVKKTQMTPVHAVNLAEVSDNTAYGVEYSVETVYITCGWYIWVGSRNCGCLVTWFCYQLIAKPGNKTATVSWPYPYCNINYSVVHIFQNHLTGIILHMRSSNERRRYFNVISHGLGAYTKWSLFESFLFNHLLWNTVFRSGL